MTIADPSLPPTADRVAPALAHALAGAARSNGTPPARRPTISRRTARGRARAAGLVIAADAQTAGRGRLGRSWHSPPGENLYVSLLLRPRAHRRRDPAADAAGRRRGRARARAAGRVAAPQVAERRAAGRRRAAARRKLAGVLTEMVSAGARVEHVVVGIGINVNATAFPAELADRATSLRAGAGPPDRPRARCSPPCWTRSSRSTTTSNGAGRPSAVAAFTATRRCRERCRVDDRLEGVALGVDPDGALRLRDDAGQIHRVISGEVQT